jgi:hypothetical protein
MSIRSKYESQVKHENSPILKLLEHTNDYTIYTHFIGREIKFKELITSPIRFDTTPTFNIFPAKEPRWSDQIMFKDFNGDWGNVFAFVQRFASFNNGIVLKDINEIIGFINLHMGLDSIAPVKKIQKLIEHQDQPISYKLTHDKWKAKHLEYWEQYGVGKELLEYYRVMPVAYLLNEVEQKVADFRGTCTFAYWIFDKFKLYQPYEENFSKFFNQCPPSYLQGFEQCFQKTNHLVITKSLKDIVVIQAHSDSWQDVIAPHGEGYKVPDDLVYWILSRYSVITIIYDPDYAGVKGANRFRKALKNSRFYQNQKIRVQFVSTSRQLKRGKLVAPVKDISDFRIMYGEEKTKLKIKQLLYEEST